MHLSVRAKQLLHEGNLDALQALGYEELLPEAVRSEILASFLRPSASILPGDSAAEVFLDPTSYSTLSEACVLSSGQILSRAQADIYFQANRGRPKVTCPISRQLLQLNIAGTGQPYVLLPMIDIIIQGFKRLNVNPPSSSALLKSFDPDKRRARAKMEGAHSAMAAIHHTPALAKVESKECTINTVEIKVARNKVRLVIIADLPSPWRDVESFLKTQLPTSKVDHRYNSYFMDPTKFGRCWKIGENNTFHVDLWFPPATKEVEIFTDNHLKLFIRRLSRSLNLSPTEVKSGEVPICSIKNIQSKAYVIAMEAARASVSQIIACCQSFLDTSVDISNTLAIPIDDTVNGSTTFVQPSRTNGIGFFPGGGNSTGLTSSLNVTPNARK